MKIASLAALLCLAASAEAATGTNLADQFADPPTRNQQDIGSCHDFTAVGLLEAAHKRAHGETIRLSERDLFLHNTVLTGSVYEGDEPELEEGGTVAGDVQYAVAHGLLTGDGYAAFEERYKKFRAREENTLREIAQEKAQMGLIESLIYDPRKEWQRLTTQPATADFFSHYLAGEDQATSKERDKIKALLKGFKTESKAYRYAPEPQRMSAADCAKTAKERGDAMLAELRAGRPVAVSINLKDLITWTASPDGGEHAALVVGSDEGAAGVVFHTRNSWAGKNPDIRDSDLCRVSRLTTVLIAGEKPAW